MKAGGAHRQRTYRAWLRERWAGRSRQLGLYAFCGSFFLFGFDLAFLRGVASPPSLAHVAAVRFAWLPLPILGLAAVLWRPRASWVPVMVAGLGIAWTWGNAATYLALGLGGAPIASLVVVLCALTAAIFMPLQPSARVVVFGLQWAGCTALDLAWSQPRPLEARLWNDIAVLAVIVCVDLLFGQFAAARRRSVILRRRLERTVSALEASRARTAAAAAEVTRLAAEVAHDVNNPLAAVKANLQALREPPHPDEPAGERGEIAADTLDAVNRIAGIVAALRRKGAPPEA